MSKNITFKNCTGYDIVIKRKTAQMKNNIKHMNKNESLVSNIYGDPYNGNVLKISRDAKDETRIEMVSRKDKKTCFTIYTL